MGSFGYRNILRDHSLLIAGSGAVVLSVIGIIYYWSIFYSGFQWVYHASASIAFPDLWPYLIPMMPALNICIYLLGGIGVFLIGKEYIETDRYIYFSVAAFLLYFPLAGIDWSVFTTISIFPSIFLLGFYFYKIGARWISGILFILSGATFLVFIPAIMLTGATIFMKDRKGKMLGAGWHFGISILLISMLLFLTCLMRGYLVGFYGPINSGGYGYLLEAVSSLTFSKPLFFIFLLIPLVTFGFFGPRLVPVTLPYYIFGIIVAAAGKTPEPIVAILDLALPLTFIASIIWIGKMAEAEIVQTETRIIKFALFTLVLMNILIFVSYIPFLGVLSTLFGF